MADNAPAHSGMLNFDAVAILSTPGKGYDPAMVSAHLAFLTALEQKGLLLLSGPTRGDGIVAGSGLTILNVASVEEAKKIWADEPFTKAGTRDAQFFMWRLMEGGFNLTLSFSDQKLKMGRP
jgi:uncharacterized protein YciI